MEGPAWHLTEQSTALSEYSDTTDEETEAKRLLYWSLSSGELPSLELHWAPSVAGVSPSTKLRWTAAVFTGLGLPRCAVYLCPIPILAAG